MTDSTRQPPRPTSRLATSMSTSTYDSSEIKIIYSMALELSVVFRAKTQCALPFRLAPKTFQCLSLTTPGTWRTFTQTVSWECPRQSRSLVLSLCSRRCTAKALLRISSSQSRLGTTTSPHTSLSEATTPPDTPKKNSSGTTLPTTCTGPSIWTL
jgi:hypothetical protein